MKTYKVTGYKVSGEQISVSIETAEADFVAVELGAEEILKNHVIGDFHKFVAVEQ